MMGERFIMNSRGTSGTDHQHVLAQPLSESLSIWRTVRLISVDKFMASSFVLLCMMLESLYVSNNYCEVYDVEGTGHLKSDSSVIGDSKVADIIFVSLTALKYHYVMLLFTSPDNINIWNMNKFSMFFICYECMVSFYLLAGIFYPLQKKKKTAQYWKSEIVIIGFP